MDAGGINSDLVFEKRQNSGCRYRLRNAVWKRCTPLGKLNYMVIVGATERPVNRFPNLPSTLSKPLRQETNSFTAQNAAPHVTGRQCAYAFVQNHGPLGLPAGCNDLRDKQRRHPGRCLLPKRRVSRKQLHSYTYCRRSFLTRAAYPCSFARFPGVPLPHHLWRRTH